MKAVSIIPRGIKCDAPDCGWCDDEADWADARAWLDKPCPKCGASLLTDGDLAFLEAALSAAAWVNKLVGDLPDTEPKVTGRIQMDGSGIPVSVDWDTTPCRSRREWRYMISSVMAMPRLLIRALRH